MFCFSKVDAIIFDLDDTLVHSDLDFSFIKRELSCPDSEDILNFINAIPCELEQKYAQDVVLQHELKDAEYSKIIDGADTFIKQAQSLNLPLAIVTRNCRKASELKLSTHNISIDTLITREDALPKPHPQALLHLAKVWQLNTSRIAYIGDYKYDIEAAHNANMQAWLYLHDLKKNKYSERLSFIPAEKH